MSNIGSHTPTQMYAQPGPVQEAALILASAPALRDHCHFTQADGNTGIYVEQNTDDVPITMWGSGAQAMWLLLLSICSTREEVSLSYVVAHLDNSNALAVQMSVAALCRR